jgi:RNA polymerase sigma-70 factor (ECF subfamily)
LESSAIAATLEHSPPVGDSVVPWTFESIYDKHIDFVWRSVRRLGVSEAAVDDVVQQVFLVVYRRLGEFEGRSSLKTWLFAIVLRSVQEHRRSMRRKSPHLSHDAIDPDLLPDSAMGPDAALTRAEASHLIDGLLEALTGDKRVVFVMAELEQMTAPEIAQVTGLDATTIYSRLRAARTDFERAAALLRRRLTQGSER